MHLTIIFLPVVTYLAYHGGKTQIRAHTTWISAGETISVTFDILKQPGVVELYVDNEDDDRLYVTVWVDDKWIWRENISAGSKESYFQRADQHLEVLPGEHTFKLTWQDLDTSKEYYTETSRNIEAGETARVILQTEKHVGPVAQVYVNNLDDDYLDIEAYVGDNSLGAKEVPLGASDFLIGESEVVPDEHTFRMEWKDDDTGRTYQTETIKDIARGGVVKIALATEKHLGQRELISNVLAAETSLYDPMWDLVVVDPGGYIPTYAKSFADIMIDYYEAYKAKGNFLGGVSSGSKGAKDFQVIWDIFIDQLWSSSKEAMNSVGLEIPPALDAYLGPDALEFALKKEAGIETETTSQFLKKEAVKYGLWLTSYAGMRWSIYSENLQELSSEHTVFQEYWHDKYDEDLINAFGSTQNVEKFIDVLEGWADKFQTPSIKGYAFKSDLLVSCQTNK